MYIMKKTHNWPFGTLYFAVPQSEKHSWLAFYNFTSVFWFLSVRQDLSQLDYSLNATKM
jgi:hypothetical protein